MSKAIKLGARSTRELFVLFGAILKELRERGVMRSTNNPIADYAELLFEKALHLQRAPRSTTGYDAVDKKGKKYEIKGRRVSVHNGSRQLSSIRGLEKKHFHFLGGVLFNEDFSVRKACLVPHKQVQEHAKYIAHTNSWKFLLRDGVWALRGVKDVTKQLQNAEKAHG